MGQASPPLKGRNVPTVALNQNAAHAQARRNAAGLPPGGQIPGPRAGQNVPTKALTPAAANRASRRKKAGGGPGSPIPGTRGPNLPKPAGAAQQGAPGGKQAGAAKPSAPPKAQSYGPPIKQPSYVYHVGVKDTGWYPTPIENLSLGLGLIGLNILTQSSAAGAMIALFNKPSSAKDVTNAKDLAGFGNFKTVMGELAFVIVLSFVTSMSKVLGRAITIFYVGLYLVWFTFNGSKIINFSIFKNVGSNQITAVDQTVQKHLQQKGQ